MRLVSADGRVQALIERVADADERDVLELRRAARELLADAASTAEPSHKDQGWAIPPGAYL